ncbi:hypothetical protein [Nocardia concava]|uniref:hypothetical protein n=1 Tax=Nocardia concava TaxID=257281 RepID=UPI0002DA4F21|nr:hypothetical protein [Nocardia concava]
MRSTVPTLVLLMAAVLLTGCGYFDRGRAQAEHDSWSRKIETAIRALPGVTDASHRFDHYKGRHFTAELDVRLRDDATGAEAASVVNVMGAQQLPRRFHGDPITVTINRMTVYDPPLEGRTLGVTVFPPLGFTPAETTQLADLHLPHLAASGTVVDYTIHTPNGPSYYNDGPLFEVVVGGCQTPGHNVLPESQPYVRQYEHC